jgi:hypothetical protein
MRRIIVVSLVLASALISLLLGTFPRQLSAQESTPAAAQPNLTVGQLAPIGEPFEVVPGIDLEILNEGEPANAPGLSLVLYRVTFRGGEVPPHMHPGTTVATVESGTFSWTLMAGTVWVTRPGAAPEETTEPGTEIVLNPGEGLIYHDDIVHTARGAGAEPAVVLVTALFEAGQPFLTLTDEHGTPLPMGTPAA